MAEKFKILAADKLAPEGLAFIESQPDAELVNKPGLSEDELAKIAGEHDAMIVRSGVQVTAKVLANPGRLKVVARAGVGVDNIDLDAATSKGILVVNSAEASTVSTAEHAFTLIMSLARRIGEAHKSMTEGKWDRSRFIGTQLSGKTLAVVGFGRIGQTVASRALAFGMKVIAYDPFFNADTAMDGQVKISKNFADLLPHADIFTFHVPLNEQTRGMLGAEQFRKCRKGVMVVNASRGGVVDEAALIAALKDGTCGGAALDVYEVEPPDAKAELRAMDNVVLTPHLGASTKEAQQAVSVEAAKAALGFLRGESISGAVNVAGLRMDLDKLQARFVDLSQRMAQLISPMITRGFAKVTFTLQGSQIAAAATMIERTALIGLLRGHLDTPLNLVNVHHVAQQRGIKLNCVTTDDDSEGGTQLTLEIEGENTQGTPPRRIVGRVYRDHRPRVVEINGYHMDMVPAGHMVLIQNEDRPGVIGLVGQTFGDAGVNIADMAISRRDDTALMLLKVDAEPPASLLKTLREKPGLLTVAAVQLPDE